MGMNPRGRSRGRNHNYNNNNRRFNNAPSRNTVYDSLGPVGRLRGTAFQLMEKYLGAAKDSMSSDRVLAENCLQHADHYMRLNAMAIAAEQRSVPQYQPQPEIAEPEGETVIEEAVEENEAEIEAEAENEPAEKPQMDLSVPISAMVENEIKRREQTTDKVEKPAVQVVPVKRRGRPPRTKTEAAEAIV